MANFLFGTVMKAALPPSLDINHAVSFLEQCQDWRGGKGALRIDASAVERITTPALQILLALLTSRSAQNRASTITNPSEAFTRALVTLGLEPHFKEHISHG